MTRGRKPDVLAVRRGGSTAAAAPAAPRCVSKPALVGSSPGMSELWDTMVGSGLAYREEDGPALAELVFNLELARQLREDLVGPDGRIRAVVGRGEPDPETGEYPDTVQNPVLKALWAAEDKAMRISDSLGVGPLARARLGLTQAAGQAVAMSIAEQIDAAMARRG